jgi:hypothetical protein
MFNQGNLRASLNDVLPHERFTVERVDENKVTDGDENASSPKVNLQIIDYYAN